MFGFNSKNSKNKASSHKHSSKANKNAPVLTDALTGLPLSESMLPKSGKKQTQPAASAPTASAPTASAPTASAPMANADSGKTPSTSSDSGKTPSISSDRAKASANSAEAPSFSGNFKAKDKNNDEITEKVVGNAFLHNPPESATDFTGYVTRGEYAPEETESLSELLNVAVQPDNDPDPNVNLKSKPR